MTIVSLDPGKWCLGWCVWEDNTLTHAGLSVVPQRPRATANTIGGDHYANIRARWSGRPTWTCVEQMQLSTGRDRTRGKAIRTANDLLMITNVAARVVSMLGGELVHVAIGTWKGSCSKIVTRNRVWAQLNKAESEVLHSALSSVRASLQHNLFDSVGIGLWATQRYRLQR